MTKVLATIMLLFFVGSLQVQAQSADQLIGKWKLVKWTKKGKEQNIHSKFKTDEVYQVFKEGNDFVSIIGSKETKGSWKLSDNNKKLTVKVMMMKVNFVIEYMDDKKRIISNKKQGALEYERVE
ncbi:lipocalin-like domain-containing protein [Echinicola strongylocentroti]|nr:lipocalin family protein [Echinicola strongylocentroti]